MVIKRNHKFGDFYFIRFRAVSLSDDSSLGSTEIPVVKMTEQGIKFCPWCGVELAKCYGRFVDALPHEIDDEE